MQDELTWQAEQFERNRAQLQAVAYRMLGSVVEAEDAVQEAWLRLSRTHDEAIRNVGGWLTTVVGRVCIDMLRARQARRVDYVGAWLPEPLIASIDEGVDPEQQALLADSVGLALLVVLERLTPTERLAFVLHDMFDVPFEEIAPMVERSTAATRQLASRARRRVRGEVTAPNADLPQQQRVVDAFLVAARAGDFEALVSMLAPDVVFRSDVGRLTNAAPAQLEGVLAVARQTAAEGPRFATLCRPALVNGAAGLVLQTGGRVVGVVGLTVVGDRIAAIDLLIDPVKLATLEVLPD
jgi:RNA polymerase sigma-70 factor (ECF subfamily)